MMIFRMIAGDKCVHPLDLVDKAAAYKEIEGTIDNGRLGAESVASQNVQNRVGAHCAIALQQDLKNLAPDRRQSELPFRTDVFCVFQRHFSAFCGIF